MAVEKPSKVVRDDLRLSVSDMVWPLAIAGSWST